MVAPPTSPMRRRRRILLRLIRVLLLLLVGSWGCLPNAYSWQIGPPSSARDWRQMASLLAATFHAPEPGWPSWLGPSGTERRIYQHYVQTARKMTGTKYAIWLAKSEETGRVVGVAELGIHRDEHQDGQKRATLGVLCVSPEVRQQGVGRALVQQCERLVQQVWQEPVLYAEVEPHNTAALAFFQSCGFVIQPTDTPIMVTVLQRDGSEKKPHLLLSKSLLLVNATLLLENR